MQHATTAAQPKESTAGDDVQHADIKLGAMRSWTALCHAARDVGRKLCTGPGTYHADIHSLSHSVLYKNKRHKLGFEAMYACITFTGYAAWQYHQHKGRGPALTPVYKP